MKTQESQTVGFWKIETKSQASKY